MKKWLKSFFTTDFQKVEVDSAKIHDLVSEEFAVLREELALHISGFKTHVSDEFRSRHRLPCKLCGQMTWKYQIQETSGKAICSDCIGRGRT
jgi:formylmethanofuran dehydrogenase subunit E